MRASLFSSATALAVFSGAATAESLDARSSICLTNSTAYQVASNFGDLIRDYNQTLANEVLTANYTDYSDSVSELINNGCPNGPEVLGQATYTSLAQFEADQAAQPSIPFNIQQVWYNCDTVFVRWQTTPGTVTPEELVTGLIVLETIYNSSNTASPYMVDTVYSEFNSGAWLYDLGVFVPSCSSSASSATSTATQTSTPTQTSTKTTTSTSVAVSTVTVTVTSKSTVTTTSTASKVVTKTAVTTATVTTTSFPSTHFQRSTATATSTVSDIWSVCLFF